MIDREPTRILVLAANPLDRVRLRLEKEVREIQETIEGARIPYTVRPCLAAGPEDLIQEVLKFKPELVHFCGHGSDEGIILEDEQGAPKVVEGRALISVFELFANRVRCVILNCCYSRRQAQGIATHVPFVIGMNAPIGDDAALVFSSAFYTALGEEGKIDFAFSYALTALRVHGLPDSEVPEIFVNGKATTLPPALPFESNDAIEPEAPPGAGDRNNWPVSTQDLTSLSWKEFERLALSMLESIYRGIEFHLEPMQQLRGMSDDLESQYRVDVNFGSRIQLSLRIWLEVKLSKGRSLDKTDVAKHIVDAVIDNAAKVILITNKSFGRQVYSWLHDFSARTGLQYQLIDGTALLQHARAFRSAPAPPLDRPDAPSTLPEAPLTLAAHSNAKLTLKCWFSLSPHDHRPGLFRQVPITPRPERPLYLLIDAACSNELQPCHITIEARIGDRQAFPAVGRDARLIGAGEHFRQAFIIWPHLAQDAELSQIELSVTADCSIEVERYFLNSVKLPPVVLIDCELRSQSAALATIVRKLDRWKAHGEFASVLLVAPPGLGKSRIMAVVRQRCMSEGIEEIFLDCESSATDVEFLKQLLQYLVPFPPGLLDVDLVTPVTQWCIDVGMPREIAAQVAEDLCGGEGRGLSSYRVDIALAVLAQKSHSRPIALFLEDLHKASPSLLSFLAKLTARLAASGNRNVALVASTRPFFSGAANLRAEWLEGLSSIGSADNSIVLELTPPSSREAGELLEKSIAGLEKHHADMLISSVGTSPFSLREGLLFLAATHHLEFTSFESRPKLTLADPAGLRLASMSNELANATEQRIGLLLANQPDWLRSLLLAGAIFGRRFPLEVILDALKVEDNSALGESLDACSTWSLLSSTSGGGDWLEFDHDLVREAVLRNGSAWAITKIARSVLETLGPNAPPHIRSRLAYQANLPDACLAAIEAAKSEARREGRVADIVELNQLAIQVLDPDVAESVLAELLKTGEQHFLDPALRRLRACVASLPASERMRSVLDLLLENIEHLATIGSGSSGVVEAAITEARLIAERMHDRHCIATLLYYEGKMWFARNSAGKAFSLHKLAEVTFAELGQGRDPERAENLVRQAICLRKEGRRDESIECLHQAARLRPRGDWLLINKVRNNLGAAYLASDWNKVRYHWEKQIRQASRRGMVTRMVHGLASLSFIDLFEGSLREGLERAKAALELAENLRLDNQIVRLCLDFSVHSLITGNPSEARLYLLKAEELALRHGIGRRLWRVSANFATTYEVLGAKEEALGRDLQTVRHLQGTFSLSDLASREILPLVNVVLRTRSDRRFGVLLEHVPEQAALAADNYSKLVIEGRLHQLPGLLGLYCVNLSIGPRFLLTE